MIRKLTLWSLTLAMTIIASSAGAQSPKREDWIPIGISPYYNAAPSKGGKPQVAVGATYSTLLASDKLADIHKARDLIQRDPSVITPMTMFVLAIRLYDMDERDDAVFWFYAGKSRAVTLVETLSFAPGFDAGGVYDAIGAFISLAGPYFNSYAFCDFQSQQTTSLKAIEWVEAHPYETIFSDLLKSRRKPGDINENLKTSLKGIREGRDKDIAEMNDPVKLAAFKKARADQQTDAKFCWK